MKIKGIVGGEGRQFDAFNDSDQWIAWVSREGGSLRLMSTGEALDDAGRLALAGRIGIAIGETVST